MIKIAKRKSTGLPVVITEKYGKQHIIDCADMEEANKVYKKELAKDRKRGIKEMYEGMGLKSYKLNGKVMWE